MLYLIFNVVFSQQIEIWGYLPLFALHTMGQKYFVTTLHYKLSFSDLLVT